MKEEKGPFFSPKIYRNNIADIDEKGFPSSTQSMAYPKVIVIDGSLEELCATLSLRFINCDVKVFEKFPVEMKGCGTVIVLQIGIVNFLKEHKIVPMEAPISIPVFKRQYLRKDDTIDSEEPTRQLMTFWNCSIVY